jgi:hypothetical protein
VKTAVRRASAAALCAVLLALPTACTGKSSGPAAKPTPPASTGSSATMQARPVPLKVVVTRVSGKLGSRARKNLEANVGRTISRYVDGAFLGGHYPRSGFSEAFSAFVPGVRQQARHDSWLLTNADVGPTTQSVSPEEQAAYLSVLAPYKVAAGVTARLRVRFVADRGDKPGREVTVTGRLMLTRKKKGGWAIFGYHLSRSVRTVGEGSR